MHRISFERDQPSPGCQSASKPDGAVATKCTNLEDGTSANGLCQHHQQFALIGRHIDGRQPGCLACVKCGLERGGQRELNARRCSDRFRSTFCGPFCPSPDLLVRLLWGVAGNPTSLPKAKSPRYAV